MKLKLKHILEWIELKRWYDDVNTRAYDNDWVAKFTQLLFLEVRMMPRLLKDSKRKRRNIRKKYDNVK